MNTGAEEDISIEQQLDEKLDTLHQAFDNCEESIQKVLSDIRSSMDLLRNASSEFHRIVENNKRLQEQPSGVGRGQCIIAAADSSTSDVAFDKSSNATTNIFVAENQDDAYQQLTNPQRLVLEAISSSPSPHGISIRDLCNNIDSLSAADIKYTVDYFADQGYIYATIDEEHFKSVE